MTARCYLCGRFSSAEGECPACLERMKPIEEYFDGFKLSDWIKEQGWTNKEIDEAVGETLGRMVRFWGEGRGVRLDLADAVLSALGLHLEDIPASCRRPPPKKISDYPQETVERAIALADKGLAVLEIARELSPGPTAQSIKTWLNRHGRGRRVFETVWDGVEKRGPDECWFWKGSIRRMNSRGNRIHHPTWKNRRVQRVILSEKMDNLDSKTCIRLACKSLGCCNPAHFEIQRLGGWQKFTIWGANYDGR